MKAAFQDILYGVRLLRKNPGLTVIAILTLTIGIGVNSAVFSVANTVMFFPFPHVDPDRAVFVSATNPERGVDESSISLADYLDWQDRATSFDGLAAEDSVPFNITGGEVPVRVVGLVATTNIFEVIGVQPDRGRGFVPEDSIPGANRVAVVTQGFLDRYLDSDPSAIGTPIILDGDAHTVIGIMPPDFLYRRTDDFWVPLDLVPVGDRDDRTLNITGRLAEGVWVAQAAAEMELITTQVAEAYPETNRGWGVSLVTLREDIREDAGAAVAVMLLAVFFILVIACANIANLLLARMASRREEIAIRAALGAGRIRIVRQLLAESVVLSVLGGIGGLVVSLWGVAYLRAYFAAAPSIAVVARGIQVDVPLLVFTAVLALGTTVLFGLVPALHGSRVDLMGTLKQRGRTDAGGGRRWQRFLVGAEIAVATTLLIAAALLSGFWMGIQDKDLGVDVEGLLATEMSLPDYAYPESRDLENFYLGLIDDLESLPEIRSAAVGTAPPNLGQPREATERIEIEGRPAFDDEAAPVAVELVVSKGYFETMGIPILTGRGPSGEDAAGSFPVAFVSAAAVRTYWPDSNPIGARVRFDAADQWLQVVGVVGDVQNQFAADRPLPLVYRDFGQVPRRSMSLLVRTEGGSGAVASVRESVRRADPNLPIAPVQMMSEVIDLNRAGGRLIVTLVAASGLVALVLSALGIYGVVSFSVAQQTREMGLRRALGADSASLYRLIFSQALGVGIPALALGLVGGYGSGILMSAAFPEFPEAFDPGLFAGVIVILGLVQVLASLIPAHRATRVDPMAALRLE